MTVGILVSLGIFQLFTITVGLITAFFPDDIQRLIESWGQLGHGQSLSSWPTDFTRDITPIPCHSHNDYWRHVPLYSAISAGCIGVEADVWLFDKDLYVGHSTASLTRNRTLKTLYIDPLLDVLSKQNPTTYFHPYQNTNPHGVFDTNPSQTLVLLIDFKTDGPALWPFVHSALEPLRSRKYLTYLNGTELVHGPITVVGTGNTPFNLVTSDTSNPQHDIFFDAPLDEMWEDREWEETHGWPEWDEGSPGEVLVEDEGSAEEDQLFKDSPTRKGRHVYKPEQHRSYVADPNRSKKLAHVETTTLEQEPGVTEADKVPGNTGTHIPMYRDIYTTANSYYASVSFGKSIGRMWRNRLSSRQMGLIRGQVRGAHRRGLKVRYWDLPSWPIGLRNHVWDVLVREGVDLLNVDDLRGATQKSWRHKHKWWRWS
ncbi:Altered inheritance of mitochondria protein 6 [Toensbergia leucococca]|nr:Altered inheritance of mitochondria protein 6 [Toensbergia leucococca]